MTRVLVTGYGPFGNTPVDPAEAFAGAPDGASIGGARVLGLEAALGRSPNSTRPSSPPAW
jgi:pyrrolidone-carboxylate peptidase